MTTIAWDGITLAGDKLRTLDGSKTPATKVFVIKCKHNGKRALVGFAGDTVDCVRAKAWFEDMRGEKPALTSLSGLFVTRKKKSSAVYFVDDKLVPVEILNGPHAIGSGGAYALGAMLAGKTAEDAVVIASRLDTSTGFGVDVVSF